MKRAVVLVFLAVGSSCNCGPEPLPDAGAPDASVEDAGVEFDAGFDAGEVDVGQPDAGAPDAGFDAGLDAGLDAGFDAGFDAGVPDAGFDGGPDFCPVPSGIGAPFRVRAMAANLTTGPNQSYTPGHGIRIMQGTDPDIVMIQEFNYGSSSPTDINTMVRTTFDGGFYYNRGAGVGGGAIPNGVISRWPIIDQGEWTDTLVSNRNFVWAQIDIPGDNDLWVISVHLLTSSAGARNNEANNLLALIRANIPENSYVLLGGDFNTNTRDENVEPCLTTFAAEFVITGPHPVDNLGNEGTSGNRNKPYDHVLASPCLARLQRPTVLGTTTFDAGAVIDTRVYMPLSDIAPAQYGDCETGAPIYTQHMGVLKDFYIQP
ncbi:MAG: endonuclease/exonuclease/phosphatase family protein [Archangium sp.]|nr:endonuclease/exonuclease/phosphatase family protein [Archangium sp.]MDP3569749.1 endonuclease/exonuclease/phosphatase family protein [Archangium sp.]